MREWESWDDSADPSLPVTANEIIGWVIAADPSFDQQYKG